MRVIAVVALACVAACGRLFEDPKQDCGSVDTAASAPIMLVQNNAITVSGATSTQLAFQLPQRQGDTIVIVVATPNAPVSSINDASNNAYVIAAGPQGGQRVSIYIASNIAAAAGAANFVTVGTSTPGAIDLFVLEYAGVVTTMPIDASVGASGNAATADSGPIVTTNAHDVIVAGVSPLANANTPGPGFTNRGTTSDGGLVEDRIVTTAGTYDATAALSGISAYDVVAVALRGS
jgi:hypothetical protein